MIGTPINQKTFYILCFLLLGRAFVIVLGTANISLISGLSRDADVSPSAIISLTILASFTTAYAFYLLYGEILNKKHWIGMICIMISVVIIGFSKP